MHRSSDSLVLRAIEENNLIFISAQPDSTYFHWQVELYLYQFAKHGIIDRCYALFGYAASATPSDYVLKLAKKYPHVLFYKDTRKSNEYSPAIRPHILAQFFKEYPDLGKNVFYHDSDIFLTKLPRFDLMLQPNDKTSYLSDTISYIGYNYIKECSQRYKSKHDSLPNLDILNGMCNIVEIDPNLVKLNQQNSGGAQYLLKNIDHTYWEECEEKCVKLYAYLCNYERKYPINHHIQKWTTDMWVVIWLYWKRGGQTSIHKELDFSWATGNINDYDKLNIFHLAGITKANCSNKFHKGDYTRETVFDAYIRDPGLFDHISQTNATFAYTNIIREYVNNVFAVEKGVTVPTHNFMDVKRFRFCINASYGGVYVRDDNTKCVDKSVWRSESGLFIMFWSGYGWIITYTKYEKDIGPKCGGVLSSSSRVPYTSSWNAPDITIEIF